MARGLDAGKYFWRSGREKCFSLDIPFYRTFPQPRRLLRLSSLHHPIKVNQGPNHGCAARYSPDSPTDSSEEASLHLYSSGSLTGGPQSSQFLPLEFCAFRQFIVGRIATH